MGLVRARAVAIRPRALMDREAAIPVTGMKCPVLCGLALPVNDVSRRQVRPPPNARATKPICYRRRLLQHPPPTPSLPLFTEGTDVPAALLLGGRAHFGLRLESVTRSRDGLDVARRAPLIVELHAELADVPIDDIALDLELTTPNRGKKIFPAERLSGVRRQKVEERLLDRREVQDAAADADALFDKVDLKTVQLDLGDDRDGDAVRPTHQRKGSRHDLVQCERDLEDVVRAALVSAQLQCGVPTARERDDRRVAMGQASSDDVDERLIQVEVDEGQVRS